MNWSKIIGKRATKNLYEDKIIKNSDLKIKT